MHRVSIVIPVYNSKDKIKNLLESIKNINAEKIVVDDGSTDGTAELVEKINWVKMIKSKHGGPAKARNIGLKNAKGEIVIFLDSDCVPTKNWFEEMLKPFNDKNVVAVQGAYINANPDNIICTYEQKQIELRQGNVMKETDNFATYSLAIRKDVLERVGGFDESFTTSSAEDTITSYKISKIGKIIFNPNAKVKHYHRNTFKSYMKKQYIHAKNRVLCVFKSKKVSDEYAGFRIISQPPIAFLSLFSIIHPFFMIFFIILGILQVPEIVKSPGIRMETLALNIIRAYVWMFGMIHGSLLLIKEVLL